MPARSTFIAVGLAAATLVGGCSSYGGYGPDPRYARYSAYDYDRPDPAYGGYGAPEGNPIQGNIMLISGDELAAPSADAAAKKSEARYTVKGLFGREVLYTARQKDSVLTLDVPAGSATFRTTVQDMQTLLNEGVSTLVVQTEKGSTTLNLSLLVEGQKGTDRVVLRRLGENTFLTVGLRCRRDLIVGR